MATGRRPWLDELGRKHECVVSPRRRDWIRDDEEKWVEYLAAGVREYWVIDRFRRTLTAFKGQPEGIAPVVVKEGEVYQTDPLPGFELLLARLLATADRWAGRRHRGRGGPGTA